MAKSALERAQIDVRSRLNAYQPFQYNSPLQQQYNTALANYNKLTDFSAGNMAYLNSLGYNKYQSEVDALFNQVMNQEKFSYDPSKDALFQMYKQQYNKQGQNAMRNAMGVGAAMSGGYNSSAAQTAAQTQYMNTLDALNGKVAETYQAALNSYNNKQQNLLNRYNIASDMNKASNDSFWQRVNTASQNVSNAFNAYSDDRNFQYNNWSDTRNFLAERDATLTNQVQNQKLQKLQKKAYTG